MPDRKNLALVEMQHAPVNALSLDFIKQLTATFEQLEVRRDI